MAQHDERLDLLLEGERRGILTPALSDELGKYRQQGLAKPLAGNTGPKLTEQQGNAAAFYTRAAKANDDFEATSAATNPRGVFAQGIANIAPTGIVHSLTSADRQKSENAAAEFVAATLRKESGAAISASEFDSQAQRYFPQPGDAPETIEQKRQLRQTALDAIRLQGGPGLAPTQIKPDNPNHPAANPATAGLTPPGAVPPATPPSVPPSGGIPLVDVRNGVTDGTTATEKSARGDVPDADRIARDQAAIIQGGGYRNADELKARFSAAGYTLPDEQAQAVMARIKHDGDARHVQVLAPIIEKPAGVTGGAGRAFGSGVADTGLLGFADEAGGVADTVRDVYNKGLGGGSLKDLLDRNIDQRRANMEADASDHGVAHVAGQLYGGAALAPVGGIDTVGATAGRAALRSGADMAAARAAALRATVVRSGQVGAASGAVYGLGSGEGDLSERLPNALLGAATGAATGALAPYAGQAISRGANALAPLAAGLGGSADRAASRVEANALLQAAQRQGIDVLPADVGGPLTRRLTSASAQAPLSAGPIINAGKRMVTQAGAARDRIAGTLGAAVEPEAAGEAARTGAGTYISRTGTIGGALYDRAARYAGGARVTPTKALDTLDRHIAEMGETPGGQAGAARLQALRDELGNGDFSVQGIRGMRTRLRDDFTEQGLRGSDIERRVNQVVDAASEDVSDSLVAQGRDAAANAYRNADQFWRNRVETIDNTLAPIIGKNGEKSGEQIVAALQQAGRGNTTRLNGFIRALPRGEQQTVRATLVSQLGRASAGAQDETGAKFSLGQFLTHWNQLTPRAKAVMAPGEARAALDDLAKVAAGLKEAAGYANRSNTSGAVWGNIGALAAGATASPHLAILGGISQMVGGRVLASPAFARWLARVPAARSTGARDALIRNLSRVAQRDPAIANDIAGLQQRLTQAMQSGVGSAAADPKDDGR
jgi:hypothetical protein